MTKQQKAIEQWTEYLESARRNKPAGAIQAVERTIEALRIEEETGRAVCSCCLQPLGKGIRIFGYKASR